MAQQGINKDQIQNRTRRHNLLLKADNAGGALDSANEGSPEVSFAGTTTNYGRATGFIPSDWVPGTDVVVKAMFVDASATANALQYYVGLHYDGQTYASWNIALGASSGSINLTANVVKEFVVHTIPAASIVANAHISLAITPKFAITGTIFMKAVFLEYTADS
jgi:hypothetical protein